MQIQQEQILLGRYRVLEQRATGGFGQVLICWDRRLTRRVAIKCMPLQDSYSSSAQTLNEALTEARTSCLLAHRNIVVVHDFEVEDNVAYLVMEYIDGLNLEELLTRVESGVLTFEETAHILDSVALALSYAHEQGVLHLDIKPANIMIDRSGQVKLMDFGMATLASATGFGDSRGGTIGYMPPEQIEGSMVDERCDMFALGCVIWRCLTGIAPFAARDAETSLSKIQKGPKPKLSKIEPELAGFTENYLLKTLAYTPQERPISCEKFADALVPILGNADAGQQSLCDLIDQNEEDNFEDLTLLDKQAPLEHIPWAAGIACRLYAAGTGFGIAWMCAPAFGLSEHLSQAALGVLFGVLSASISQMGSAVCLCALCTSLIVRWYATAYALTVLGIVALMGCLLAISWRLLLNYKEAHPALLSGCAFHGWWGAIPYAALMLKPHIAAPVAGISSATWIFIQPLISSTDPIATMIAVLTHPMSWIHILLSTTLAASVSFLIRKREFRRVHLLLNGGLLVVVGMILITFWVENAHSYLFTCMMDILFAVILFELLSCATVLLGSEALSQEAEK